MRDIGYRNYKSYGIKVKSGGKVKVLNLLNKGTPNIQAGSCKMPLAANNERISSFEINVYENDFPYEFVELEMCEKIHEPVKLEFKKETYGDDTVHIQLSKDESGNLCIKLFNERTFEYFKVIAKRLSEDVEEVSAGELRLG